MPIPSVPNLLFHAAVSECQLSSPDSVARTEAFLQIPPADRTFNTYNYLGGGDSDDEAPPTEDVMEVKKGTVPAPADSFLAISLACGLIA